MSSVAVATRLELGNATILVLANMICKCKSENAAASLPRVSSNNGRFASVDEPFCAALERLAWSAEREAWHSRARLISFIKEGRVVGCEVTSAGRVAVVLSILWTVSSHAVRVDGDNASEAVACFCCSLFCLWRAWSAHLGGPLSLHREVSSTGLAETLLGAGAAGGGSAGTAGKLSKLMELDVLLLRSVSVDVAVMSGGGADAKTRSCEVRFSAWADGFCASLGAWAG